MNRTRGPRATPVGWILLAPMLLTACSPNSAAASDVQRDGAAEVAVHVATIRRTTLRAHVLCFGRVESEPATAGRPAARAMITSAVAGRIVGATCFEGQRVEAGAPCFGLDSRLAVLAVDTAQRNVDYAQQTADRQHALAAQNGTSTKLVLAAEQALDQAQSDLLAAQTQRDLLRITAPISGTVTRVSAHLGQAVDASTVLAEVIDLQRMVVTVEVPVADAMALAADQPAEIESNGVSGMRDVSSVAGRVAWIAPQVDPLSSTVSVRLALTQPLSAAPTPTTRTSSGLRPGQLVRVRITTEERTGRLAVPVESVDTNRGVSTIAVVQDQQAHRHEVQLGLRDGGLIEVQAAGLSEGTTIVTDEIHGLPEATRVRVIE